MEELKKRHAQLKQAYKRLRYMVHTFEELRRRHEIKRMEGEENELITHRDALIQRFEFCYDLTWKFFKLLLKQKHAIDAASPRKVFQECYRQGLLSQDETESLLAMAEARNETAHVYDESAADVISRKIVHYYEIMEKILHKIE